MLREIVKYPSAVLKKTSEPVSEVTAEIRQLIDDMFETMYAAPGVGLAAPQVGISKRILVIDVGLAEGENVKSDPKAIINPEIKVQEGKIIWEEGCLSLPQLIVPVERSKKIIVEGLDVHGKPVRYFGEDLLSVAFQHEIDHLDGKLIVERLSQIKKELYMKKLKAKEKSGEVEKGQGPAYIG